MIMRREEVTREGVEEEELEVAGMASFNFHATGSSSYLRFDMYNLKKTSPNCLKRKNC